MASFPAKTTSAAPAGLIPAAPNRPLPAAHYRWLPAVRQRRFPAARRRWLPAAALALAGLLAAVTPTSNALARQTAEDRSLHAERVVIRALTFMRTGYPDRAVETYTEGLRVNPDEPVLLSGMADAQLAAGDPASAQFYAARAVELAPDTAAYLDQLARIASTAGDLQTAFDAYERLADVAPGRLRSRMRHVELLERVDRLDDALVQADRLHRQFPAVPEVLRLHAGLLHRTGRTNDEIGVLRELLLIEPSPDVRYDLAVALDRAGDSSAAVSVLTDLLIGSPDEPRARALFGELISREDIDVDPASLPPDLEALAAAADPADADSTSIFRRRLEADPDDSDAASALARHLVAQGSHDEAAELLIRQIDRDPRRVGLWIQALELLVDLDRFDQAVELGEEGALLYPGYAPIAYYHARGLLGVDRTSEALEIAGNARAALDDDDPMAMRLDDLIEEIRKPQ